MQEIQRLSSHHGEVHSVSWTSVAPERAPGSNHPFDHAVQEIQPTDSPQQSSEGEAAASGTPTEGEPSAMPQSPASSPSHPTPSDTSSQQNVNDPNASVAARTPHDLHVQESEDWVDVQALQPTTSKAAVSCRAQELLVSASQDRSMHVWDTTALAAFAAEFVASESPIPHTAPDGTPTAPPPAAAAVDLEPSSAADGTSQEAPASEFGAQANQGLESNESPISAADQHSSVAARPADQDAVSPSDNRTAVVDGAGEPAGGQENPPQAAFVCVLSLPSPPGALSASQKGRLWLTACWLPLQNDSAHAWLLSSGFGGEHASEDKQRRQSGQTPHIVAAIEQPSTALWFLGCAKDICSLTKTTVLQSC